MGRKRYVAAFVATLAATVALAAAGSASATAGTPVTISGQTIFANGFGTFTTSAGSGLCASGVTTDVVSASGGQSNNHIVFHDIKTFTCDDGSGTFTMEVEVVLFFGNHASFSWSVMSGTGAYTELHGTGKGLGLELPGEVDDSYMGSVHFN